tara:strand:+ start:2333 stop:2662 length:330 start_codon:yes stop_codon:yes gene_type:complete
MDFEKINIEDLHRVLIFVEQQHDENIDLANKVEGWLMERGYDLDEIYTLIHSKDGNVPEDDVLLVDIVNSLRFSNALLSGLKPLCETLVNLSDENLINKINNELDLNLN